MTQTKYSVLFSALVLLASPLKSFADEDYSAFSDLNATLGDSPLRGEAAQTGAGKAVGRTLYISAETVGLYMDPEAIESMPDGYSKKDLNPEEISYDFFGKKKTITVVKGSELERGEKVVWFGTASSDDQWLAVEYHGLFAWIRREELTAAGWKNYDPAVLTAFKVLKLPEGEGLEGIVELAKSRVGDQYVWGGASPGRFDCSGLMQWAYRHHGVNIPRTSRDQKAAARPISEGELQPGDMVFTGNPVKHVMMYTGEGQLVEAMGRKWGVVTSSLQGRTSGGKAVYYGTFRDQIASN